MACFFKNPSTNNYEAPCPTNANKSFRCDFLHDVKRDLVRYCFNSTTINPEVDTNNWRLNTRQNTHSTESLLHPLSDHGIHGTCCVYHCASHIATKYQSSLSPTASFHTPVRNTTIRTITQSSTPDIITARRPLSGLCTLSRGGVHKLCKCGGPTQQPRQWRQLSQVTDISTYTT